MLIATLAGCAPPPDPGDPIVGAWISVERYSCNDWGNYDDFYTLELDEDLRGDADIYFTYPLLIDGVERADCVRSRFAAAADALGSQAYQLELTCIEEDAELFSCGDLDFYASCEMWGEELSCEGEGAFDWFRVRYARR